MLGGVGFGCVVVLFGFTCFAVVLCLGLFVGCLVGVLLV